MLAQLKLSSILKLPPVAISRTLRLPPLSTISVLPSTLQLQCGSTCRKPNHPLASLPSQPHFHSSRPPLYSSNSTSSLSSLRADCDLPASVQVEPKSVLHPRVAVLLGVDKQWHVPLLICRGLSTAPAAWWGLRCALTFLGELVLAGELDAEGNTGKWSVERRFRVTEVFLAVLWVSAVNWL